MQWGEWVTVFARLLQVIANVGSLNRISCWAVAGGMVMGVAGCAQSPPSAPVTMSALPSPVVSEQSQHLTQDEMAQVFGGTEDGAYLLGPSDIISVNVYDHPELSVPNPNQYGNGGGVLITSDGSVGLPLIGDIHIGGMTLPAAEAKLQSAYAQYVVNPRVAVEVQQAQSMRYYLLGAFTSPGVKYPVHPLDLLDALALGGSVDIPSADLYQAYVAHGNVKLPIDMHALLVNGDLTQNATLLPGDVIVIPTVQNEQAFVFGSVSKPGPVGFQTGTLSLLQALSDAGLDLSSITNGELSQVRIIRSQGANGQLFVVNATMIMQGKAASFALEPGDIVFVPPSGIATWNQAINQLLPSLEAVSDILNPFVSIKYLTQRNN